MYPRFPPFEARLAVTVFLRHIVSVLPKCGELFTFGSPAHTQVTQMVDWMKAAYSTVDVSQQGKRLLMALQYFLEAEWCERMATRTENLDAYIHDDLLFSAACSLNETLPFLSAEKDKLDIPAPQILGAEYRSDTYAAVVLSGISREAIQVKIRSHLDGGRVSKKHTAGFDRPLFKAFLLDAGHSHPSVATALFKSQVGALLREWPNVVTILNGLLYRRALTVLDDTELLEEVPAEEICKLLVSGCVDPARPAMHAIFADVLQKLTLRTPLLEYPHSCFLPPVSVNFVFEKRECVAVSGCVAMVVSFFTTSTADIVVHNIKAEVVRLTTNEEKNSAISDTVVACAENDTLIVRESLQPDTQCTTRIGVCFPRPGKYRCTRLLCDAVVGNVTVPISFNVDSGTRKRDCRCAEGEIIHVCMPTSLLTVDGPTTVEAVEGETVSVAFTISSTEGRLVNGKLLVPNTECFFEMESGQAHAEEKAGMGSDEQLRVHTLPNVDGGETTSFLLSGQCARSGYFAIPLLFQYESRDGVIVEVTRTLRVAVDPPFDVFFSCANSVRWCGDDTPESMLFHPTTSAAHVRKDVHVLEDAVDVTAGARGLGAKFFYCIRTDVDGLSCSTPIPLEEHSTMTVVATVVCRSKNGLGVSKADFVCSNHVELQYVSYGLLPCQLEMGESVTIAAQIRATRKMENFLPGFVRVLFSPGGDNTARLFTDLGLPAMTVVSTPVTVTTAYPPFVECGQPFIFRLSVQNTAMAPFQGELTLDTRAKEFSIGGRAQWFFSLGPREEKSTELLLTPLVHGVCSLPRFQIRSVTNGFVVSTNRETRAVTVL